MQPTIRPKENVNSWNVFFSILFAFFLFASLVFVAAVRGGFPRTVPLFDVALMVFATMRLTRLLVYDKITRWFRELFVFKRELIAEDGSLWVELIPLGRGIRHTIHDILQCPWCIGVWAALVIVFAYLVFPWAWYIILILAVAGASTLFQVIGNAIGWKAENLKFDVRQKERDRDLMR